MVHLSEETLSELLDGGQVEDAKAHLSDCEACRDQLAQLAELQARLRALPEIGAPAHLWEAIEARISADPAKRSRGRWPKLAALQLAGMAAVFVIGLGLGASFMSNQSDDAQNPTAGTALVESPPMSLDAALEEVKHQGIAYDAALRRLEEIAGRAGTPTSAVTAERLAALDVLVEATRTALASDPADPVLNTYLFAALEEREDVMRELATNQNQTAGSEIAWR